MHELLTCQEMAEADRRAVALGVPSLTLMENAGRAVADEAQKMVAPGARIAVLCGPGNNGGDGFVAARYLKERGHDVRVACVVPVQQLKGDAAEMARRWDGEVAEDPREWNLPWSQVKLTIDALFGAGLSRPINADSYEAELIQRMNAQDGRGVLAVDVPSGLNGTTGLSDGPVVRAERTVTFFRKKPGHVLMPGRLLCGEVVVADIGISAGVLNRPHAVENSTELNHWRGYLPRARLDAHKYTRGHALVVSGPVFQSGAARMSARAALRVGAGLVTVASPTSALPENAAHLTAIMLRPCPSARALSEMLEDKRKNAVVIGPGAGVGEDTRELVLTALKSGAACVLDADALTSFAQKEDEGAGSIGFGFTGAARPTNNHPETLFAAIRRSLVPLGSTSPEGRREGGVDNDANDCSITPARSQRVEGAVVLTPHEGEFKRLFGDVAASCTSKLERARKAAEVSGAVVVLKGPDTVIARPDGFAAINTNGPPTLATAGSGDVLAGFIGGLLAQGMPAFEAACAAVWLHGECANVFGPGLIAEDLPEVLPQVLKALARR